MHVVNDVRDEQTHHAGLILTIGSFDGIHLGHRRILETVIQRVEAENGTSAVLTMRPHPREFFTPGHAPNLLTDEKKKLQLLEEAGVDVVFFLDFNVETANLEPEAFVETIIRDRCHAQGIVVGHDCRFGKGAKGDYELLEGMGPQCGFTVEQVPPLFIGNERVSSTLIRERVLQGDLDGVQALLGRRYSIAGEVIRGRGMGVKLGFPTANVKPHHSATPAQGVYIAEVLIGQRRVPSAVNIGIAPTIRHEDVTIEAHLLGFEEDIRGAQIEIVFHSRIRSEKKFASLDELMAQIRNDVETAKKYFDGDSPKKARD